MLAPFFIAFFSAGITPPIGVPTGAPPRRYVSNALPSSFTASALP